MEERLVRTTELWSVCRKILLKHIRAHVARRLAVRRPAYFDGLCGFNSGAWGPPQFQEKRSRSEKAILGALGEFWGILGAALGVGNSILGIRNSILGMASHDLINTKPTILGATLGAIPGIAATPPERFSFAPAFSERFFKNWGGPRAPDQLQTAPAKP